jgi:hypothetical protein
MALLGRFLASWEDLYVEYWPSTPQMVWWILAHVSAIQIYCVVKKERINPRSLNTDVIEWFFGDGRQMVGGSQRKMTANQWDHAGFKATAFDAGRHNLVGNNKTGENMFNRDSRRF